MGKWIAMGMALLLAGCATSPVPVGQADQVPPDRLYGLQQDPDTPHGTVQITRDSGVNFSMCTVSAHVDGTKVADFKPSETASFYVSPGEHVLGVSTGGGICANLVQEIESSIGVDENKRYRIYMDASGTLGISRTAM